MAEFKLSQKGKSKLCYEGFVYIKDKEVEDGEVIYWRCERKKICKGRAKTVGDTVHTGTQHNHAPDATRKDVIQAKNDVKIVAATTRNPTHQILAEAVATISEVAAVQLPKFNSLKRTIQRQRTSLPSPRTLAELTIPENYTLTLDNEQFLMHDSGKDDEDRFLIFSTQKNLQLLAQSKRWYSDGTFKTVPEVFFQLYTIHAEVYGTVVPLVYVLMPKKTEQMYTKMLEQLLILQPTLAPDSVLTDYEIAAINAFTAIFRNVTVSGCLYHLSQSIYKRVQSSGLQTRYANDAEFALQIRMIAALSFVPKDKVVDAFERLVNLLPEDAEPVIDYFEDNYIGRSRRNRRTNPKFHHDLWNCYKRVVDGANRTNNAVEAWHRRFGSAIIMCNHPSIWKFIDGIKSEQKTMQSQIERYLSGEERPRKSAYQDIDRRILSIVNDYINRDVLDYLRGIAHNLKF